MAGIERASQGTAARFFYEMREGSRRQGNVLFALIFKEVKSRAGLDSRGFYSLAAVLLEPVAATLLLTGFWYIIGRMQVGGVHVALFVAVSYAPFGMIRRSLSSIPRSLKSNLAFYAYQQVKPFDSITAQFIVEIALTLIGGAILLFGLWWFLGLTMSFDRMPEFLGMLAIMAASGFGLSLLLGTYGTLYPVISKVVGAASRGIMLLCAVMHPIGELPSAASYYISWNPVAHMEEKLREYALGIKPYPGTSVGYPAAFALIVLFLGFASYQVNRFKVLER